MNKKYKKNLKELMTLICTDYMCNIIKLNIYKKDEIFNTKNLKIEFRDSDTDKLIHTIKLKATETINEQFN